MLVLSRKPNESIIIADNIVVTVLSVKAGTVKLGITAPSDVRILRAELMAQTSPTEPPTPSKNGSGTSRTLYAMTEA